MKYNRSKEEINRDLHEMIKNDLENQNKKLLELLESFKLGKWVFLYGTVDDAVEAVMRVPYGWYFVRDMYMEYPSGKIFKEVYKTRFIRDPSYKCVEGFHERIKEINVSDSKDMALL